jgi:flagellar motor switch protein FliG
VVELLRLVDLATEKVILEGLERTDPETANEIRKRMFVFENVTLLDDRSIQRVLREVDGKDLGLALKGATEEVRGRIVSNMSERASKMLLDDMAALGPVRLVAGGGGAGPHRRRDPPAGGGRGDLRHARWRG